MITRGLLRHVVCVGVGVCRILFSARVITTSKLGSFLSYGRYTGSHFPYPILHCQYLYGQSTALPYSSQDTIPHIHLYLYHTRNYDTVREFP